MAGSSQQMASTGSSPTMDPLDLLDLADYDGISYQSPSISPSATNKMQYARPTPTLTTTPATMPTNQMLSGPSHQYDQYKQQTPFVPGALANTLAINEGTVHIPGYNMEYLSPGEEVFDFNSPQNSMTSNTMDLDFDSTTADYLYGATPNINPHTLTATSPTVSSQTSNIGRMYPGYHQRAALAKAQQQQQQQQEMIQRQMNQPRKIQQNKPSRSKTAEPTDPIIQQKISQVLSSMRTKANTTETEDNSPLVQIPRQKKEDEDMDDDERLLASEEGKKLSSKERRQLRNKVSARAFRSRRKEYITQLENEIASKVSENNDLRAENQAFKEENQRYQGLVQMLLSSTHFSSFLNELSLNPAAIPQSKPQVEQRQVKSEPNQVSKDPNPYNAMNMGQQQQIGMVMIPEQNMDLSMLNINANGFVYQQPHVYAVLETPELPEIDTGALMGKSSNFVGESTVSDGDKTEVGPIEAPIPSVLEKPQAEAESIPVEKRVANLDGDIFDDDDQCVSSTSPLELDTDGLSAVDIFGGIEPEKAFARYDLVDSTEEDIVATRAVRRVERLAANLAATISRLERLDVNS
ncbi:hypothetical protein F5B22DRAFT_118992 [Xylaria bambusicola]|uniref:uncharacterized protein n=1 Tax=Xylaria bambusicola TaxID=326684 RepID=UPI0020086B49|nr:uncharacterized protein F5B22DRAFT_118992 [Xylaria bambusicola]KAI0517340.1 hypothetical protein F5B22DRAFT_118992 [Xylaria bambusicola]